MTPVQVSIAALALFTVPLTGCGGGRQDGAAPAPASAAGEATQPRLLVRIFADGHVTLDGEETTLDEARARLGELRQRGGVVWYYRQNPQSDPHPNAMEILDAIAANELPIALSADPDFANLR